MTPLDILYVEDDPDIRHVVRIALSLDPAIRLLTAESGGAALAMLDRGLAPDAALLDMMMPGMDGLALLAMLRARPATANLPAIFMTAKVCPRDRDRYREGGGVGLIVKPFDPLLLAAQVRTMLARTPAV
jgi:CheY-like chemotaxis protein